MTSCFDFYEVNPEAFVAGFSAAFFSLLFFGVCDLGHAILLREQRRWIESECDKRFYGNSIEPCHCAWCPSRGTCRFYEKLTFKMFFKRLIGRKKEP